MEIRFEFLEPRQPKLPNWRWFVPAVIVMILLCCWAFAHAETIDLDIIAQIESSNNPLAYNRNSQAKGLYQITPICLKDYNIQTGSNLNGNALFSPSTSYRVAKWYIEARIPVLLRKKGIVVTIDNVLWAYNAGIGKVVKGVMPKETRQYIKKYHKLVKI